MNSITINFTKRLPDINKQSQLPPGYNDYGRFAITNNDDLRFASISSSHSLFISPRGSTFGFPEIIGEDIIGWLLDKLRIRVKQIIILK